MAAPRLTVRQGRHLAELRALAEAQAAVGGHQLEWGRTFTTADAQGLEVRAQDAWCVGRHPLRAVIHVADPDGQRTVWKWGRPEQACQG